VPARAAIGARDAVRSQLIVPLEPRMHQLAAPSRNAFIDLAVTAIRIDPPLLDSITGRSRRWPMLVARWVPLVGRPLAIAALDLWSRRGR